MVVEVVGFLGGLWSGTNTCERVCVKRYDERGMLGGDMLLGDMLGEDVLGGDVLRSGYVERGVLRGMMLGGSILLRGQVLRRGGWVYVLRRGGWVPIGTP